jgi:hypothetical protein
MKKQKFFIPLLLFGCVTSPAIGQEKAAENLEEKARNVINNPSMQNLFRQAKKDPEGLVESMKQNPSDLVKEAQHAFEEKKSEVDMTGIDTPENRRKMEGTRNSPRRRCDPLCHTDCDAYRRDADTHRR